MNATHPNAKRSLAVLAALLAGALALPACGGGLIPAADTPTPSATVRPTDTPTPTPSPTVPAEQWPVVLTDTFDKDEGNWPVGEVNSDYVKGVTAVVGGKYYMKLTAKKPVIWYTTPDMPDLLDAYVTVKVNQISGAKTAEYGIILRDNANSQYFFSIGAVAQGYEFLKYAADEWNLLTMWTTSSRILVGEPNLLAVKAQGPQFSFFINGTAVDDARDEDTALGKFGIGIALSKAGDTIEITFDSFEVRSPEAE
jgi:hypothetical protein